jgi:hypothetical protein
MAKEISMKYPKDAYYLNSELKNKQRNNQDVLGQNFEELKQLLTGKEVFEVGFDFGQRLYALKDYCKVIGGVEFDPNFGLYKKHANLFDHGWDIRFTQLEFWKPKKRKCVFTNNFLSIFNDDDRLVLLQKLKDMSEELFLNESCELNLEKQGNIYVFNNVSRNDIKSNSGTDETKEIELPSFKSLEDRLKRTMADVENARENKTRQSNPSGGV